MCHEHNTKASEGVRTALEESRVSRSETFLAGSEGRSLLCRSQEYLYLALVLYRKTASRSAPGQGCRFAYPCDTFRPSQ